MGTVSPYADPAHPGNSAKYHTGKECVEPGCNRPAGTQWSKHWCFECNVVRMRRITKQLKDELKWLEERRRVEGGPSE